MVLNKEYIFNDSYMWGSAYKIFDIKEIDSGKNEKISLLFADYLNKPIVQKLIERGLLAYELNHIYTDEGHYCEVFVYNKELIYADLYNNGRIIFKSVLPEVCLRRIYYGDELKKTSISYHVLNEMIELSGRRDVYYLSDCDSTYPISYDQYQKPLNITNRYSLCPSYGLLVNKYGVSELSEILSNNDNCIVYNEDLSFCEIVSRSRFDIDIYNKILLYLFGFAYDNIPQLCLKTLDIDIGGIL